MDGRPRSAKDWYPGCYPLQLHIYILDNGWAEWLFIATVEFPGQLALKIDVIPDPDSGVLSAAGHDQRPLEADVHGRDRPVMEPVVDVLEVDLLLHDRAIPSELKRLSGRRQYRVHVERRDVITFEGHGHLIIDIVLNYSISVKYQIFIQTDIDTLDPWNPLRLPNSVQDKNVPVVILIGLVLSYPNSEFPILRAHDESLRECH